MFLRLLATILGSAHVALSVQFVSNFTIDVEDWSKVDFSRSIIYPPEKKNSTEDSNHNYKPKIGASVYDMMDAYTTKGVNDYWWVDGPHFEDKTWYKCHHCAHSDYIATSSQTCQYWEAHMDEEIAVKVQEVSASLKMGMKWGEKKCKINQDGCFKRFKGKPVLCSRSTIPLQRVYGWVKQHLKQCGPDGRCYNINKESNPVWVDYTRPIPGKYVDFWCDNRDDLIC
jgi:hypothetical protein